MATLVITGTADRFIRLAQQIEATARESRESVFSITIDNGVANSVGSVTGPQGKRRDS